jgi:peptide/nickel transport system permease protein
MSLVKFVARRTLAAIPMLLVVAALTFAIARLAPGDPAFLLGGEGGTPEYYAQVRREFGLDRPLAEQLVRYLWRVAQGDLGRSLQQGQPVLELILQRLPATGLLAGSALLLASVTGILLGIWTASQAHRAADRLVLGATALASAVPVFWTGLVLTLLFSLTLGWLPVQGMMSSRPPGAGWARIADLLAHLVLPVVALGLQPLASFSRLTRAKVLETLAEPYIRTARAKGLPDARVMAHAARNALLPVVTIIGGYANVLVTGAVLTETVFAWPGLGRLALDATLTRDYPLIMGLVLVASAGTVVFNLATDLMYAMIDPRITYG